MRSHTILIRVLYMWCSINLRSCSFLVAFGVVFICLLTLHLPVEAYVSNNSNLHIYIGILRSGVVQYIVRVDKNFSFHQCALIGSVFHQPPVLCVTGFYSHG